MRHKQASLGISFDILAPDIKMHLAGKSSIQTRVGSALSVFCIGAFIALGVLIVSDYLDKTHPKVTQETVPSEKYPEIKFAENKLYPILFFNYQVVQQLPKPKLDRFVTVRYMKVNAGFGADGKWKYSVKEMKVVPCKELVARGERKTIHIENEGLAKDSYEAVGVCVDPDGGDMALGQTAAEPESYQTVFVTIGPCSLGAECVSEEELSKVSYSYALPTPAVNFGSHDSPVRYFTEPDDVYYRTLTMTTRIKLQVVKKNIYNDAGFPLGKKLVKSYTDFEPMKFSLSDRNKNAAACSESDPMKYLACSPFFVLEIMNTKKSVNVYRSYKGFVETISEIGGMIDLILIVVVFAYNLYNNKIVQKELVYQIYGLEPPEGHSAFRCCRKRVLPQTSKPTTASAESVYEHLRSNVFSSLDVAEIWKELRPLIVLSHLLFDEAVFRSIEKLHMLIVQEQMPGQAGLPRGNTIGSVLASDKPLRKALSFKKRPSAPGHSKLLASKLAPAKILQPGPDPAQASGGHQLERAEDWRQAEVGQTPAEEAGLRAAEDSSPAAPKDLLVQLRESLSRTVREKFHIEPEAKQL